MLIRDRHRLILWTVREGDLLKEALDWCHERGVDFWAVNRDYPEEVAENNNHFSRKLKADYFIDDRGINLEAAAAFGIHTQRFDPKAPEATCRLLREQLLG